LNEHEPVQTFAESLYGLYPSLNQPERPRRDMDVPKLFTKN
jgi:hypothetical protein